MDFLVSVSPRPHFEGGGSQKSGESVAMAQLSQEFGINANTVSRYLAFLGIKPERKGNFRFLTQEQYEEVCRLRAHLKQGYEMKTFDKKKQNDHSDLSPEASPYGLKLKDCEKRWGLTCNAVKNRAKFLRVKIKRPSSVSSYWPWDDLALGDELHSWIKRGNSMRDFNIPAQKLTSLRDWAETTGISLSTAYELLKLLQIEPEKRQVQTSRKPVSHLTVDQIVELNPWAKQLADGATLPQIKESILDLHPYRDDLSAEPVCYVSVWGDPSERLVAHRNDDRIFYLDVGSPSWIELPILPL